MGIKDFFKFTKFKNEVKERNTFGLNSPDFLRLFLGDDFMNDDDMSDVTYNVCLRILSESLSKLPLKMYQDTDSGLVRVTDHPAYKVLRKPNPTTSPSSFWAAIELNRNQHGNAYAYIERNPNGTLKHLWVLPSTDVQVKFGERGIFGQVNAVWYHYQDKQTGKQYKFHSDEVLHFKTSVSFDGYMGLSIRQMLGTQIDNSKRATGYLNNYYKTGLMGKGYLTYENNMNISEAEAHAFAKGVTAHAGGSDKGGTLPIVPPGFKLETLNMNMVDAQFLPISKYTSLQIASAFGIKPSFLNDYDKGNYANVETQQRDFYINTLLPILKAYEEEISSKLLLEREIDAGYKFEFNPNVILRADYEKQVNGLVKLTGAGILSSDEGRDALGYASRGGNADELFVNSANVKIDDIEKPDTSKGGGKIDEELDGDQE
ncbi:phage portal protein [Peribacillus frigoritolerans]|uniref:phage portal protein n=1 Tax=Peribacillus frigoritolerans TaxID=450367 RepID=UPI002E1FF8DC|nr:phage portal protein [Peribacillus frigoritolerans]